MNTALSPSLGLFDEPAAATERPPETPRAAPVLRRRREDPPIDEFFFDVQEVPVEAVLHAGRESEWRMAIPGKKALVHRTTRSVLGVVGRDYRVVTNREAVQLARDVCAKAFPGISPGEWEPGRASGPQTRSYALIDLMHRTHVLNYWDNEIKATDPFTPFLRVTNSFNGARALRFDIGFLRKHCSNGVIFEEAVATIRAAHSAEALQQLQVEITTGTRGLDLMWKEFSAFLSRVRRIEFNKEQSNLALDQVLHLPKEKPRDSPARKQGIEMLRDDIAHRLEDYREEFGSNAYAVFNTLTDVAARPPDLAVFQTRRDTLEKRAGRWLRQLAEQSRQDAFDLNAWLSEWDNDSQSASPPGRN